MNSQMGTMTHLTGKLKFKVYSVFEPLIKVLRCKCCKSKKDEKLSSFDIQLGQVREAKRKFNKVRDITTILRAV